MAGGMKCLTGCFVVLCLALASAPAAQAAHGYDVVRPWDATPACISAAAPGAPEV